MRRQENCGKTWMQSEKVNECETVSESEGRGYYRLDEATD